MLRQNHSVKTGTEQQNEVRLTEYLDALEKPLESLGIEARANWRQEAEGHLLSLIAAHEELGSSHEEAVTAALQQFGNTQRIGKQVAGEIRKQRRVPPPLLFLRIMFVTLCLGLSVVTVMAMGIIYQSETTLTTHHLVHFVACSLFIVPSFLSGWNWRQLFESEKRKWMQVAMTGIFPLYGFFCGSVYATMFHLRLGADAAWSPSALIGILSFSAMALIAARLQKRLQERRLNSVWLAQDQSA